MVVNSVVFEQKRFFVEVNTFSRRFTLEVQTSEEADFIHRAVEFYTNFDSVMSHMNFALQKMREVEPKHNLEGK